MPNGRTFVAEAVRAAIPSGAVLLACRRWGVPRPLASELAEEAAQEAYLRGLDVEFPAAIDFFRWTTLVAKRVAIDLLRQRGRAMQLGSGCLDCVAWDHRGDAAQRFREQLDGLADDDQRILRMTFEEDMTLDAMVAILYAKEASSPNALRLRLKRRRDQLLARLRANME